MPKGLIDLDDIDDEDRKHIDQLMLLAPPGDRDDVRLRRLLLFRLRLDGFPATRNYLVERTRAADRCRYAGDLYDYLKDESEETSCRNDEQGERK